MAELVDALDSKSCELTLVRVQVPPRPPRLFKAQVALFFMSLIFYYFGILLLIDRSE